MLATSPPPTRTVSVIAAARWRFFRVSCFDTSSNSLHVPWRFRGIETGGLVGGLVVDQPDGLGAIGNAVERVSHLRDRYGRRKKSRLGLYAIWRRIRRDPSTGDSRRRVRSSLALISIRSGGDPDRSATTTRFLQNRPATVVLDLDRGPRICRLELLDQCLGGASGPNSAPTHVNLFGACLVPRPILSSRPARP